MSFFFQTIYISTPAIKHFTLFRFESIFGCQGKTLPPIQEVEPDDVTSGQGWVRRAARVTLHWPIRYWLLGRTRPCLTPYFLQTIFDTHFFQTIFYTFSRLYLTTSSDGSFKSLLQTIFTCLWKLSTTCGVDMLRGGVAPGCVGCTLLTARCSITTLFSHLQG